jgi:hypothetical protein
MKKILGFVLLMTLLASCKNSMDYPEHHNPNTSPKANLYERRYANSDATIRVERVDGCEYVVAYTPLEDGVSIVHKANCINSIHKKSHKGDIE